MPSTLSGSALAAGDGKFVFPRKPAASAVPLTCKIKQLGAKVDGIGLPPANNYFLSIDHCVWFLGGASPGRGNVLWLVGETISTYKFAVHCSHAE